MSTLNFFYTRSYHQVTLHSFFKTWFHELTPLSRIFLEKLTVAHLRGYTKSFQTESIKVKVKLFLCFNRAPRREGVLGEWRCSSTHSLISALDEVSGQLHAPANLPPGKGTHLIGGWVGPRTFRMRWWREKFPAPAGNRNLEPRSSSP
jgi:hypothetical protein